MKKKGWKVVRRLHQSFMPYSMRPSLSSIWMGRRARVEYKRNRWTEPNHMHGPLCVFTSRETADEFSEGQGEENCIIFRCEYEPSGRKTVWTYGLHGQVGRNLKDLPAGTALASRVKLTGEPVHGDLSRVWFGSY